MSIFLCEGIHSFQILGCQICVHLLPAKSQGSIFRIYAFSGCIQHACQIHCITISCCWTFCCRYILLQTHSVVDTWLYIAEIQRGNRHDPDKNKPIAIAPERRENSKTAQFIYGSSDLRRHRLIIFIQNECKCQTQSLVCCKCIHYCVIWLVHRKLMHYNVVLTLYGFYIWYSCLYILDIQRSYWQ